MRQGENGSLAYQLTGGLSTGSGVNAPGVRKRQLTHPAFVAPSRTWTWTGTEGGGGHEERPRACSNALIERDETGVYILLRHSAVAQESRSTTEEHGRETRREPGKHDCRWALYRRKGKKQGRPPEAREHSALEEGPKFRLQRKGGIQSRRGTASKRESSGLQGSSLLV